ncbi:MAG: hypothetical protein KAU38_12205, partial [Desulfobacterales bacterium]|nr:hypothetical protein [Desulfobacterales bacterium]
MGSEQRYLPGTSVADSWIIATARIKDAILVHKDSEFLQVESRVQLGHNFSHYVGFCPCLFEGTRLVIHRRLGSCPPLPCTCPPLPEILACTLRAVLGDGRRVP